MSKDIRQRRPKCILKSLLTFAVFIITSAVIILYIRFGLTITDTLNSNNFAHNAIDIKQTPSTNLGIRFVVTDTKEDFSEKQKDVPMTNAEPTPMMTVELQKLKNYSAAEMLQLTSRSLGNDIIRDDRLAVESSLSKNKFLPITIKGNLTNNNLSTINPDETFDVRDDENDNVELIVDTEIHQTNNRQVKHEKINHNHYSRTKTDKLAFEEDTSTTNYHNPYHLSYNMGDYGYKNDDNLVDETVWSTAVKAEPTISESSWPEVVGGSGSWDRPTYGIAERYPVDYGHKYKLPKIPIKNNHKLVQHKLNTVDWHKIGVLALIKLGLIKLKTIGFFKVLFLLVFKLKLYMIAVFFKFVLIIKFMKFLNILILPLFIIRLLPTLLQLLDMIRRLVNSPATSGSSAQSSQSGGLLPGRPGLPNALRPGGATGTDISGLPGGGSSSSMAGGSTLLPGGTSGTDISGNRFPGTNSNRIPGGPGLSSFERDDSDGPHKNSLEVLDPALEIFQKILDSEKCVERIACRIAGAEKTGIMPFWINWMLFRISKFIPNDKLESYLKTYKDVNNEIHIESSTPNNWTTWCSERYDCNNYILLNAEDTNT